MSEEREARDAFEAWAFEKRRYRRGAVKGGGYVSPPANGAWEGWKAALEWQAARHTPHLSNLLARIHRDGGHYEAEHGTEKAVAEAEKRIAELNGGRTAQEPVATLHDDGHWTWKNGIPPHASNYAGWRMDVYAATIGDNGAKDCNVDKYVSRMCEYGTKGCTTEHAQPAARKRVELMDDELADIRTAAAIARRHAHGILADRLETLARAQAKGE